jgi:hypothetical protein
MTIPIKMQGMLIRDYLLAGATGCCSTNRLKSIRWRRHTANPFDQQEQASHKEDGFLDCHGALAGSSAGAGGGVGGLPLPLPFMASRRAPRVKSPAFTARLFSGDEEVIARQTRNKATKTAM